MLADPLRRNKVRPTKPYYSNIPSTGVMDPDPGDQVLSGVYFFSFCSGGGQTLVIGWFGKKIIFFYVKMPLKKSGKSWKNGKTFTVL